MLKFIKETCEEFKVFYQGEEVLSTKSRIEAEDFFISHYNANNCNYAIIREFYIVPGINYKASRFFVVIKDSNVVYKPVPRELEEAIDIIKDLNNKRLINLGNGDDALKGVFVAVYPKNNKYVMEDPIKHKTGRKMYKVDIDNSILHETINEPIYLGRLGDEYSITSASTEAQETEEIDELKKIIKEGK